MSGGKKRGKNEGIRDSSFRTDSIRIHRKALGGGGTIYTQKQKSQQSLLSARRIYSTGAQPVGSLKCKSKKHLQR